MAFAFVRIDITGFHHGGIAISNNGHPQCGSNGEGGFLGDGLRRWGIKDGRLIKEAALPTIGIRKDDFDPPRKRLVGDPSDGLAQQRGGLAHPCILTEWRGTAARPPCARCA